MLVLQHMWLHRFLLIGTALVVLGFSCLFTLTTYNASLEEKPVFKANISSTEAKLNCLGVPSPQAGASPSLTICAPTFDGITAGAFGSHIIVSICNIPTSPTNWLLVNDTTYHNILFSANTIHQCIA